MRRTNTAKWSEKAKHWRIDVQKDNIRKSFYSSTPGKEGLREANAKADNWLENNITDTKLKVTNTVEKYLEQLKLTTSKSDRIEESIRLLRSMGFQAIFCSPSNKAGEIAPFSAKTLLVDKQVVSDGYRSVVVEWTKEMGEIETDEEV